MVIDRFLRDDQALGDLLIETTGADNPTNYNRSLDLDTGIVTTEFTAGGVQYRREVFASFPANAIVVHLTASKPATFSSIPAVGAAFEATTGAAAAP